MKEIKLTVAEIVNVIKHYIAEDIELTYIKIFEEENKWWFINGDGTWCYIDKKDPSEWKVDELVGSYWEKFYDLNCFNLTDNELDTVDFTVAGTEVTITIDTDKELELPQEA